MTGAAVPVTPERGRPPRRARTPAVVPLAAAAGERLWFLDAPFRVQLPGARFDRARKAWVYSAAELPDDLVPFASRPYSRLRWLEDEANGAPGAVVSAVAPKAPRLIQTSGAAAIDGAADGGWRSFLLCDDVGTGKTITLWLGALAIAERTAAGRPAAVRILVLVDRPAAITIPHWRNTIAAIGDGGHRILISSPDQLPKLLSRNGRPWARWDIVIADECHLYRNTGTRRTEVFQRVARFDDPPAKAPFLLLASATPGQHPAELTYLAPIIAQLRGERPAEWADFGGRLARVGLPIVKGTYGKWGWDERAASDPLMQQDATEQVRGWLADNDPPLTLHRAAPWGAAPLELMPVELDPAERAAYRTLWGQFRAAIAALAEGFDGGRAEGAGFGIRRPSQVSRVAREGRTAVLRFRQKASLLRVPATVDWAQNQVAAGYQVAVSCEFVGAAALPIADALRAKGIEVARIHGAGAGAGAGGAGGGRAPFAGAGGGPAAGAAAAQASGPEGLGQGPAGDLELERMRFQSGAASVVVFTPSSSLSLHANEQLADGSLSTSTPRIGLMHNVRYSGLTGRQILGRTHRDHQVSPWWVSYAEATVEERIAQIMIERFKGSADTAGADTSALAGVAELLGVSWLPADVLSAVV